PTANGESWMVRRARSVVASLLAKDASVARPEEKLFEACLRGDLPTARRLLLSGVDPNGFSDRYGCTPLLVASRGGFHRLTAALIGASAHLDVPDICGLSALMVAARKHHVQIVRLLLLAKASTIVAGRRAIDELGPHGPLDDRAEDCAIRLMLTGSTHAVPQQPSLPAHRIHPPHDLRPLLEDENARRGKDWEVKTAERARYAREAETRMLQAPYALLVPAWGGAEPKGELSTDVDTDECKQAPIAAAGVRPSGFPWEIRAERAPYHPLDESEERKRAEWRQRWNPLLGNARPDCDRPTHRSRWDAKLHRWVPGQPGPPVHLRRAVDQVSTMDGFEIHFEPRDHVHEVLMG
ncbi:MAG: hypothetical protein SGPRY_004216, partial [Prymnesium sp.]